MTHSELIQILTGQFYNNFAQEISASIVRSPKSVAMLYELPDTAGKLSPQEWSKLLFRRAYVLEKIYFDYPHRFAPYTERFVEEFPQCRNESAKRHFGKMMSHLLTTHRPTADQAESIAESAAAWAIAPRSKVAVKIYAIEILMQLKEQIEWIEEVWPDLLAEVSKTETPAISVRKRAWQ